jgi:DNA-binding IclR family transcriptional regulator
MSQSSSSSVTSKGATPASSHTRLIQVVDALVRRESGEPWGVRELAAELAESRSTVNRILVSLVEIGLASEAGIGKYGVGPRIDVLARTLGDASRLLDQGADALDDLAATSKCTALVSVFCPSEAGYFVAARGEASAALTFRPELGVLYPLAFGDIGRTFADFIGNEMSRLDDGELVNKACCAQPLHDGPRPLLESEFPRASLIIVRRMTNGLIVAVSVHSASSTHSPQPRVLEADVTKVIARIQVDMESGSVERVQPTSDLVESGHTSTVGRLERLLLLACAFPQGVNNSVGLHEQLLCNAATAKRLIESGAQAGLVSWIAGVLYPGPKLYQWAARINAANRDLADMTRKILSTLVQETGETIALLSYDETLGKARFLDVIQGWRPIQYKLQVNVDVPLYAGAAGKAVLASCDGRLADSLELVKITDATITSHQQLRDELQAIRARGWATGEGERVLGAFGLAVPFFVDGRIRGSISATIPQYRKSERDLPLLLALMQDATAKIERLLSLGVKTG